MSLILPPVFVVPAGHKWMPPPPTMAQHCLTLEPPRAEARRILSVTLDFCKSLHLSSFSDLHLESPRDWCSSDEYRRELLRTLCAHLA